MAVRVAATKNTATRADQSLLAVRLTPGSSPRPLEPVPVVVPAGTSDGAIPDSGVGYISHEFNRGEVEDYVEVMVRRQNKGYTS